MGLLPNIQPRAGAAPPQEAAAPARDPERYVADGEPNVSAQEQAEYDEFTKNGMKLFYTGGEVNPEILKALEPARESKSKDDGKGNPAVLALANATVQIVTHLDDSARNAGKPVSDDVLYHGGIFLLGEIAEIAETANIHTYTDEEITGAVALAADMYRPKAIQDGRTTEDTLKQQFGEITQADEQGRLGEVLPGFDEAAQKREE